MNKLMKPTKNGRHPASSSQETTSPPQKSLSFPIIGIGASAGGLEALEQFLRHVPEKSGMAFVIIQHLDPTQKGMMPELLQRATPMKVIQVLDRMQVRPECIYVIPPNKDMSILHGVLHLFEPAFPRGLRLPVDFFLRSLADDRQDKSIGVILSGMGSDGTMGLRAIKEKGGVTMAQDPASASFDSMPRSAIDAGLVDLIAPAEELPEKIITYLRHPHLLSKSDHPLAETEKSALEKIIIIIRSATGQDFSLYKKQTMYRRIERRMGIHRIGRIALYVRYLRDNPQEVEILFRELLIGVSSFFRDLPAWDYLQEKAIPSLLADRPSGGTIRAWSVGCSTGEEPYSLAIVFREALEKIKPTGRFSLQIFATDLCSDAIDKARRGGYQANIAADVSPGRLARFFSEEETGYRIGKEIRETVTFATQNAIMDPPFTKIDILICRNLLIYLAPELQKKLLPLFHYCLNPGGLLFLGSSETISTFTELFSPLDLKLRIYRRCESSLPAEPLRFPASFAAAQSQTPKESEMIKPSESIQSHAERLLLQSYSPPAVLVNDKGDIIYISGRTGKYLEPASGKANWNIFAMAREGLRYEITSAFHNATRRRGTIVVKGLKVGTNGGTQIVDITVQALEEPAPLRGMVMIVFSDVATTQVKKTRRSKISGQDENPRALELEQELHDMREELQMTREEMQSSQEELKSTNEELQSTNEELQSTNEELTTSREELQSLNEELQTVNAEQQAKMEELTRTSDDMRNLLNSTEIITIFLDNELHVRRFTNGASKIFKLIPDDVGRALSDITSNLLYPGMTADLREVLRTLVFSEKEIAAADGRWFTVRIMPYRAMGDIISGVVITVLEITAAKRLETELREENTKLRNLLDAGG